MTNRLRLGILVWIMGWNLATAQQELDLQAHRSYPFRLNDIWGYAAPDGREYALVGTVRGVSIVALDQPGLPEVGWVPGTSTPWRDLKTFGHYAFVTADGNVDDGLLIIDLAALPDSVRYLHWRPSFGETSLGACHNLYIDEGLAYLAGCAGINSGGLIVLDLRASPEDPQVVGFGPPVYAHDVFVQDGLVFTAELLQGTMGIYDGTDPADLLPLAAVPTPFAFTHNSWASPDNQYVFATDERANAPTVAYDISDLNDVREVGRYRPAGSLGTGVIPHNVHVFENWLVLSHYTDGLRIVDASRPSNLVETAFFDSSDTTAVGFFGAWGAYPYLPSRRILLTDIQRGLFVLEAAYTRAAYLEGEVRHVDTGQPISGVTVRLESEQANRAVTDNRGLYRTGLATGGPVFATFSHPAFRSLRRSTFVQQGEVRPLDVVLEPKPRYQVRGLVRYGQGVEPVERLQVQLRNAHFSYDGEPLPEGRFAFAGIVEGEYVLDLQAWGGLAPDPLPVGVSDNRYLTLRMDPGYVDDFHLDWGWTAGGDATSGHWLRERPDGVRAQDSLVTPARDSRTDRGHLAMLTDPQGGPAGTHDVDSGAVWLRSPAFHLGRLPEAQLVFDYWFYNSPDGDDRLQVWLSNGQDSVAVFNTGLSASHWRRASALPLAGHFPPTDSLYLVFQTADQADSDHIVEAALDDVRITAGLSTSTEPSAGEAGPDVRIFPNPFAGQARLTYTLPEGQHGYALLVYSMEGRLIERRELFGSSGELSLGAAYAPGTYVLGLADLSGRIRARTVLVKRP